MPLFLVIHIIHKSEFINSLRLKSGENKDYKFSKYIRIFLNSAVFKDLETLIHV